MSEGIKAYASMLRGILAPLSDEDRRAVLRAVVGPDLEELAALAHDQWSGWMRYLFSKVKVLPDGSVLVYEREASRWLRQMMTPYERLPDDEKESDRVEARRVLEVIFR